jgi:hypothetical protein
MPEFQETNRIKPMTPLSAKRIEFNQSLKPHRDIFSCALDNLLHLSSGLW